MDGAGFGIKLNDGGDTLAAAGGGGGGGGAAACKLNNEGHGGSEGETPVEWPAGSFASGLKMLDSNGKEVDGWETKSTTTTGAGGTPYIEKDLKSEIHPKTDYYYATRWRWRGIP